MSGGRHRGRTAGTNRYRHFGVDVAALPMILVAQREPRIMRHAPGDFEWAAAIKPMLPIRSVTFCRQMTAAFYTNFFSSRCSALIQRTVPLTERMTTVCVSMISSRNLTPCSIGPSVMPVAANRQSPRTMSSI